MDGGIFLMIKFRSMVDGLDDQVHRELMRRTINGEDANQGTTDEPIYGKVTGCFAASKADALRIAVERQPNTAIGGTISQDLPLPRDFETVAELVRPDDLEGSLSLGNDPGAWREGIARFERLGFTHLCLHDVSEDQRGFIDFAKQFVAS